MRERYHFSDFERKVLIQDIRTNFSDIHGLLILVTCNRTELYFESEYTNASQIRDLIINTFGNSAHRSNQFFSISDESLETMQHVLQVSSGLASSVLGDAEIIHQIKMAYQQSYKDRLQGSLLERCMQSVFKGHKRISNETAFRDGTTSVAYKTLKLIANSFDLKTHNSLKILFIGAGDIVKQLLNYNNKFGFNSVYIANRTARRAEELAQKFGAYTYAWDRVLANDFEDFNAIVTAVSNRPNLVNRVTQNDKSTLLLDLAVPGNINKRLAKESHFVHYDLDTIAKALKENHNNRMKSIQKVDSIIQEELQEFNSWLTNAPIRNYLSEYKGQVNQWLYGYLRQNELCMEEQAAKIAVNRIIRRSVKLQGVKIPEREMELIIQEHV